MLPKPIQNLIDQFTKLPSVGPRQAARFAFYLIKQSKSNLNDFAKAIIDASKNLNQCSLCFRIIECQNDKKNKYLCSICKNPQRDKSIICIVEKDTDVEAVENTGRYNGLYHVLGESGLKEFSKPNIENLHLKDLIKRIKNSPEIKEIIIATSATTEGDTLALYIAQLLKKNLPANKQITRLGRGLSTGSELEYMDEETLSQALLGRK